MTQTNSSPWINLASERLGARALWASDDFFAPKERLIKDEPAVFIPGKYDDNGKWMDGWESRRKRGEGYDSCVVALAKSGRIHELCIDTSHFTGNYPPAASVELCYCAEGDPDEQTEWTQVVAPSPLQGNSEHHYSVASGDVYSHVRLNIFPDGGVARLRVMGEPHCEWDQLDADSTVDLISMLNGGRAIECNDEHFGSMHNLLAPGRGVNMGDGWETRRRREPGHDWVIIALGHAGTVQKVEIDTAHFKGNFPHQVSLQGAYMPTADESTLAPQSLFWRELLPPQAMQMDHIHHFEQAVADLGPLTHVRMNIHPDGGVSRLRLWGKVAL